MEDDVNGKNVSYWDTPVEDDVLAIPIVNLNTEANFPQLCGRRFLNPGGAEQYLSRIYQDISFKLDQSGAEVRSTSSGVTVMGEPPPKPRPRQFIFNQPFLRTVWKAKASLPYLAVWVAGPDVLMPYVEKKGP